MCYGRIDHHRRSLTVATTVFHGVEVCRIALQARQAVALRHACTILLFVRLNHYISQLERYNPTKDFNSHFQRVFRQGGSVIQLSLDTQPYPRPYKIYHYIQDALRNGRQLITRPSAAQPSAMS